jgi:hypothetical protein
MTISEPPTIQYTGTVVAVSRSTHGAAEITRHSSCCGLSTQIDFAPGSLGAQYEIATRDKCEGWVQCEDGHVTNHAPENICPQCRTISEGAGEQNHCMRNVIAMASLSAKRMNRSRCSKGGIPFSVCRKVTLDDICLPTQSSTPASSSWVHGHRLPRRCHSQPHACSRQLRHSRLLSANS